MVDVNTVVLGAGLVSLGAAALHARELRVMKDEFESQYHRDARRLLSSESSLKDLSDEYVALRQQAARKAGVRQVEALLSEAIGKVSRPAREKEKLRATVQHG